MEWGRTDQAPTDTWVVGCWRREDERTRYTEIQYTHDFGWMNRDRFAVPPPDCWAPLPSFA
jgi:hypothetical protein